MLAAWPPCAAGVVLSGHVVDENNAPVAGAHVTAGSAESQTGPDGAFELTLPAAGEYRIGVEREGYYALEDRPVAVNTGQEVTLVLNSVREIFQSEDVNKETSPVAIDQLQNAERLTGTEINTIPYANSHSLRSSLILMPGVLEDQAGTLHVNGSSENQLNYVLNSFNITNPISGQFQTDLAVEGIRSVDVLTGQFSPQLGRGSAGVMAIQTENGADKFRYTATDFIPGSASNRVCASETGIRGSASRGRLSKGKHGSRTSSMPPIRTR